MNKPQARSAFLGFIYFIKTRTVFLFLLPVFFVLHGFVDNYDAVDALDAFLLTVFYIAIIFIIAGTVWLFYRDFLKAALLAFILMAYHFFFGVMQDALTDLAQHSIVSQYRFILPVSCLFFLSIIIWLKKRKKTLFIITYYLNVLLLLLILIDAGSIVIKNTGAEKNSSFNSLKETFTVCDTCKKPDVYFILLDEYASNESLKELFNFDNSAFENGLSQRGFHISKRSSSNYNKTLFSMASALNMDYLSREVHPITRSNVSYGYGMIRNSNVVNLFKRLGYKFYNLSVFDFPGQPANKYAEFLPYGTELITMQTFISRLKKTIRADILSGKIPIPSIQEKILYEYLNFNDKTLNLTKEVAAEKSSRQKFVYAHFMMPHFPYYFDSKGNPVSKEKLKRSAEFRPHDYVEYLQYTNGKILPLVDSIFASSSAMPVIILLGDHGFRFQEKKTGRLFDFSNLNAIYLPDKNYSQFSDDMSNVNFFRIFFNTSFNQHFPLLKDSTINSRD
jgi:hypothetical protein